MRRLLCVAALVGMCVPVFAQQPKFELYGGFSYGRLDVSPDAAIVGLQKFNSFGWHTSFSEYINSWFGATVDFSGMYARPTINIAADAFGAGLPPTNISLGDTFNANLHTFMFGPSVSYKKHESIQPFAHFLIGGARASTSLTSKGQALLQAAGIPTTITEAADTRWAMGAGGGVDIRITKLVAVRGQADWIRTTFPDFVITSGDDRQNHIRVSGGIVFRFY